MEINKEEKVISMNNLELINNIFHSAIEKADSEIGLISILLIFAFIVFLTRKRVVNRLKNIYKSKVNIDNRETKDSSYNTLYEIEDSEVNIKN